MVKGKASAHISHNSAFQRPPQALPMEISKNEIGRLKTYRSFGEGSHTEGKDAKRVQRNTDVVEVLQQADAEAVDDGVRNDESSVDSDRLSRSGNVCAVNAGRRADESGQTERDSCVNEQEFLLSSHQPNFHDEGDAPVVTAT